ncbi:hypothetical protein [Halorussus amylolyticus]|uniref:hypothetical protein n=1 Tax=Halorussus amylolyticus TaxID=1126242 RepID=UPI001053D311|nr:hypothetical protein [Halorussus amylolyticus]
MKEGTGGDPFADDDSVTEESSDDADTDATAQGGRDRTESLSDGEQSAPGEPAVADDGVGTENRVETESGVDDESVELPWAVRRSSVKSDREMVQFYLRGFVQDRETEFQHEVETETGYGTYLTDVREAAYLVAMNHPDEVASLLDEWGCEYL